MKPAGFPSIQRRLDGWELLHLRELAADLAQRLEASEAQAVDLRNRLDDAEERERFWHDQVIDIANQAQDEGSTVCMSMSGEISVSRTPPMASS